MRKTNAACVVLAVLAMVPLMVTAETTIITPPVNWPAGPDDTRNPLADSNGWTWSASWQETPESQTGVYHSTVNKTDGWGSYFWGCGEVDYRPGVRSTSESNLYFKTLGFFYTGRNGWSVVSIQPPEDCSVSISGTMSVDAYNNPQVNVEIYKLSADGSASESVGNGFGLNSTNGWTFDYQDISLAGTERLCLRLRDVSYGGDSATILSNFTIMAQETSRVPGDANGDGMVDVGDLGILAGNYGLAEGATWGQGDFNSDGAVDVGDLGILAGNYGFGAAGSATVPEPMSLCLVGFGGLALLRRRR